MNCNRSTHDLTRRRRHQAKVGFFAGLMGLTTLLLGLGQPAFADSANLPVNQPLTANKSITSPDGQYRLIMQQDGNLVEYTQGRYLWSTRTDGHPGAWAIAQGDGNIVVYSPTNVALWASGSNGPGAAQLYVQDDSNLVLYNTGGAAMWASQTTNPLLAAGETLTNGQYLNSTDGRFKLIMQGDGNLVEYQAGQALWWTKTSAPGSRAVMQTDGNLVVYSPANVPQWWSGSSGQVRGLTVQTDGNLVVYSPTNAAMWQSGSSVSGPTTGHPPATAQHLAAPWTGYPAGECTRYAYTKLHDASGLWAPNWGNAWQWAGNAQSTGWTVDHVAAVHAVAVFQPNVSGASSVGHVAYVESVQGNQMTISEYNFAVPHGYSQRNLVIDPRVQFIHTDR